MSSSSAPEQSRISTQGAAPGGRGLTSANFRKISVNGFGDPHNCYAWGRCYFKDHLYIGTARDMLQLVAMRFPYKVPMEMWPVVLPAKDEGMDLRGQIWRYSFAGDLWDRVYLSPIVDGLEGRQVPLAHGFRNMVVFQGTSDPEPCIYTIPGCGKYGHAPVVLRSQDGVNFATAGPLGLGLRDSKVTSYRGLVPFKGKLFTTPAGSRAGEGNVSYNGTVLCTDDPANGGWQDSSLPALGDPTNLTVFDLGVCGNHLYAGTINVRHGCQVWKTDGEGPAPHHWQRVLDRGADRGVHNQFVLSFAEFKGAMYVGTGIQNGGHDRQNFIGREAGEVLRIWPDDSWEIVMGLPRLTRHGPMFPISGLNRGFDNFLSGYIWRMCVHDGNLYVGTFNAASLLPFADGTDWPDWVKNIFDEGTLDHYLEHRAGAQLWRTADGDNWRPVTLNGLGNRFNWGIRTLFSTPHGLVIGTANPFGPCYAKQGPLASRYEKNPQGGCEIWLGSADHLSGPVDELGTGRPDGQPSWTNGDGSTPTELIQIPAKSGGVTGDGWGDLLDAVQFRVNDGGRLTFAPKVTLSLARHGDVCHLDEVLQPGKLSTGVLSCEEHLQRFFGQRGLRYVGYWFVQTSPSAVAAKRLVEELIAPLTIVDSAKPAQDRLGDTRILVLGKSVVEVARFLCKRYSCTNVSVGVTDASANTERFSPVRVGREIRAASGAFDVVLLIEGGLNVDSEMPLCEVRRVLKLGGRLLASDLIGSPVTDSMEALPLQEPPELRLAKAGFVVEQTVDITSRGWRRFHIHRQNYMRMAFLAGLLDRSGATELQRAMPGYGRFVQSHCLVQAKAGSEVMNGDT